MRVTAVGIKISVGVGEWITLSAQRHPDKPCFVYVDGSHHTFGEIDGRVNRLANTLRAEGFARGDRIAVLALDSHRSIETILAAMKIGATSMPLNWRLTRGEVATPVAASSAWS
jgi:acyl-CoA synthetase (AMP-forming)/AMP-acid ligase II